tara:strand:- start:2604 stop:3218 length:615 start_codon:yes stop_codon:yes gene_type:complete
MSKVVATQAPPDASLSEIDENATTNQKTDIINALAVDLVMPNQVLEQRQTLDYGALLLAGSHGGFQAKGSRTTINGSPSSVVRKQIVVTGNVALSNLTLVCDGNNPAVVVRNNARLALNNCHIVKADGKQAAATDTYLLMETGSYAAFIGCVFYGNQSNTGALVYNQDAGSTNRGSVVGCVNLTDVVATPFVNIAAGNILGVVP